MDLAWKYLKLTTKTKYKVQAALAIRGFDYSRTKKPRITLENCQFQPKVGLKCLFWYSRFEIFQERNPRE